MYKLRGEGWLFERDKPKQSRNDRLINDPSDPLHRQSEVSSSGKRYRSKAKKRYLRRIFYFKHCQSLNEAGWTRDILFLCLVIVDQSDVCRLDFEYFCVIYHFKYKSGCWGQMSINHSTLYFQINEIVVSVFAHWGELLHKILGFVDQERRLCLENKRHHSFLLTYCTSVSNRNWYNRR